MNPAMIAILGSGLLFFGILLCIGIGYRIGRKRHEKMPESTEVGFGNVDAAVFGLLGLILAFTYSGAATRLEVRRAQIVQEANAIGTAYLRVDMLPPTEQPTIRALFRKYLDSRIEAYERASSITSFEAARATLQKSANLQTEIWKLSVAACQSDPKIPACMLVLPPLNEMFDISTTRMMAAFTHAPTEILVLLVALALLAALLAGFAMSAQAKRSNLHMVLFALTISITVYAVLDLEYPRHGVINLTGMDRAITQLRDTIK